MQDEMVVALLVVTNQVDRAKAYFQGDRNQSGSMNERLIRPGEGGGGRCIGECVHSCVHVCVCVCACMWYLYM